MNGKQFGIIALLGIVIGGLGFLVLKRDQSNWESSSQRIGQKVLNDFDINAVTQVTVKTAETEVNLVKGDGGWTVSERGGYPANFEDVSHLIYKAWDLKVLQSQKVGASQRPRLELVKPGDGDSSGTWVSFKGKAGSEISSILLGKEHAQQSAPSPMGGMGGGYPNGRYVLPLDVEDGSVALVSEAFTSVNPEAEGWLNKDFMRVQKIKRVKVKHPDGGDAFELSREKEGADGQMAEVDEGETLDSAKASRVLGVLSYPSFNDVLSSDSPNDDTGLNQAVVASIDTFEGFHYEVKIGQPEGGEDYYLSLSVSADLKSEREVVEGESDEDKAKADEAFAESLKTLEEKLAKEKALEGWIYKVSKWTVEPLVFERKDLYAEKEEESSEGEVDSGGGAPALPPIPQAINPVLDPLSPQ